MLNQQALRKKLASTHNIKHITEAIELVASVKLQNLFQKIEHFRFYATKLMEIVQNLKQVIVGEVHPFFDVREVKKRGIIIVTSDKGLCGSYNSNLLKHADDFLEQYSNLTLTLTLFGQKAVDHYSKKIYEIQNQYTNYTSKLNESTIKEWSKEFVKAFEDKELDEVWIVYTHYKNILVRETRVEKLLPMQSEEIQKKDVKISKNAEKNAHLDYILEPNPREVYLKIIPNALYTKIQSLLLESQASELSARVVSMKAATTNADDMIKNLTLEKNKIRQFGITQEILEINAGAEGIK